jgi:dephospho-CoA kinase
MADRVLYIDAPVELRIERVMRRDNASRDAVLSRISSQPPVDMTLASWIIDTSSDRLSIEKKIAGIVSELSGNQLSYNLLQ